MAIRNPANSLTSWGWSFIPWFAMAWNIHFRWLSFSGFLVAINSYRWFKLTFFIPRLVGGHDFNLWVQVMWNSPSQKGHDCRSARSRFFYHTYMHYIYIFIYILLYIYLVSKTQQSLAWGPSPFGEPRVAIVDCVQPPRTWVKSWNNWDVLTIEGKK